MPTTSKPVVLSARGSVSARGSISARGHRSIVPPAVPQQTVLIKSIRGRVLKPGALTRFFRAAGLAIIAMIRLKPRLSASEVAQIKTAYDARGGVTSIVKFLTFAQTLGVQVSDEVAREVLAQQRYTEGHVMSLSTVVHVFERCKRDQLAAQIRGSATLEAFDSLGGNTKTGVVEVSRMMAAIDQFGLNVDLEKVSDQDKSQSSSMSIRGNGGVISYQTFTDLVETRKGPEKSEEENWWTTVEDEDWLDTRHQAWSPQRGEVGFEIKPTASAAIAVLPPAAAIPLGATSNSESFFSLRIDYDNDGGAHNSVQPEKSQTLRGMSFRTALSTIPSVVSSASARAAETSPDTQKARAVSKHGSVGAMQQNFSDTANAPNNNTSLLSSEEGDSKDEISLPTAAADAASKRAEKHGVQVRPSTAPGRSSLPAGSKAQRWKEFLERTQEDGKKRSASRAASAAPRKQDFILSPVTEPCFEPPAAPAPHWRDDIKSAQMLAAKQLATHQNQRPPFDVRPASALSDAGRESRKKRNHKAVGELSCPTLSRTTAEELAYVPRGTELMGRWTSTECNPRHALSA
jgi:hypothetical protein